MTYEQIEESFDEKFLCDCENPNRECYQDDDCTVREMRGDLKSFLKQSFIKYLQSEVERLEKTLIRNEEFGFCKHCPFHKGDMEHDFGKCAGHDQAISDTISHHQNMIKELCRTN